MKVHSITFVDQDNDEVTPFSAVHSSVDSAKDACQNFHDELLKADDRERIDWFDFGDQQFGETKARVRYIITRCDVL